jgi:hypothetical protein
MVLGVSRTWLRWETAWRWRLSRREDGRGKQKDGRKEKVSMTASDNSLESFACNVFGGSGQIGA